MSRFVPAAEKIERARALIQKARDLPPPGGNRHDFSYIAQVNAYLEQARDLVKFIPRTVSASPELKQQVNELIEETKQVSRELLR